MIARQINIPKSNSFFLFGARGTGKTSLLQGKFNPEKTLCALKKDFPNERYICVCRESVSRLSLGVEVLPWREFFVELGLK